MLVLSSALFSAADAATAVTVSVATAATVTIAAAAAQPPIGEQTSRKFMNPRNDIESGDVHLPCLRSVNATLFQTFTPSLDRSAPACESSE